MRSEEIRALDEIAARAMPADEVVELDGWLLRTSALPAGRLNSVWPLDAGSGPLPSRIAAVERHYAALHRPAAFQLSPAALPPDLEQVLGARGYAASAPVLVQTLALHEPAPSGREVTLRSAPDTAWLQVWRAAGDRGAAAAEAAARMFGRVTAPSAFAGDGSAAVGRGVLDGGWLGIFAMATAAASRRRGAAAAVLRALLRWGWERGAHGAYLQCAEDNAAARSLYARSGFTTAYRYHYRHAAGGQPAGRKLS